LTSSAMSDPDLPEPVGRAAPDLRGAKKTKREWS
jgi:hypothetical protein